MAVMVMTAGAMVTASANNHGDQDFSYYNLDDHEGITGFRDKQDSTSSYMKCNHTNARYEAWVIGKYNREYATARNDCSHGYTYKFATGTTKFLKNWVYENGYDQASICSIWSNPGTYVNANGVWSPDSI